VHGVPRGVAGRSVPIRGSATSPPDIVSPTSPADLRAPRLGPGTLPDLHVVTANDQRTAPVVPSSTDLTPATDRQR
jgi:hypothetical protein